MCKNVHFRLISTIHYAKILATFSANEQYSLYAYVTCIHTAYNAILTYSPVIFLGDLGLASTRKKFTQIHCTAKTR